ncbi:ATP-binding protein [Porphyromonadaceae bacterium OttesenSCG-928-L07]|nr:ATP-binding protein [Porphyromonadaceae bacterium OttesenSCG-928-L07]
MNKQQLKISSEIGNIVQVENFIDSLSEAFDLMPELFGKISLPVVEAVNNAILSGNKQNAEKYVTIEAWKEEDKFFISVEDEGEGFDYMNIPDPTLPDNLEKVTGRGLFVMKMLSDEMIFENNGSKVILVFNL